MWAFFASLFGYMPVPWLLLFLNSILLALAGYYFSQIFAIKSKLLQFLIGSVLITFPYGVNAYSYLQWQFSYGFGLFMLVYASYLLRQKPNWKGYLFGLFLLTCTLGIYQAFVCMSIAMMLLLTILELIETKKFAEFFRITCIRLGIMIACCVSYYLITHICLWIFDVSFSHYQGAQNMFSIRLDTLWNNFCYIISRTILYMCGEAFFPGICKAIFFLFLFFSFLIASFYVTKRYLPILWLAYFLLLLSPRVIEMLKPLNYIHEITMIAYLIVFGAGIGFVCYFVEQKWSKHLYSAQQLLTIILIPILFLLILNANRAAVLADLMTQASQSFMTRLQGRIEQVEGYGLLYDKKKLFFIGNIDQNDFPFNKDLYPYSVGITFSYIFTPEDLIDGLRILGMNVENGANYLDEESYIALLKEAQNRDNYPALNSIFKQGDMIVIKLKDFEYTIKEKK